MFAASGVASVYKFHARHARPSTNSHRRNQFDICSMLIAEARLCVRPSPTAACKQQRRGITVLHLRRPCMSQGDTGYYAVHSGEAAECLLQSGGSGLTKSRYALPVNTACRDCPCSRVVRTEHPCRRAVIGNDVIIIFYL